MGNETEMSYNEIRNEIESRIMDSETSAEWHGDRKSQGELIAEIMAGTATIDQVVDTLATWAHDNAATTGALVSRHDVRTGTPVHAGDHFACDECGADTGFGASLDVPAWVRCEACQAALDAQEVTA